MTVTDAETKPSKEDMDAAETWSTNIGKYGGVILDSSQRRGLAYAFFAHRVAGGKAWAERMKAEIVALKERNAALVNHIKDNRSRSYAFLAGRALEGTSDD